MRRFPRPGKGRQVATYDQLTSWAGPEGVTRLRREDVAGWRIPDAAKVRLVETGTPVAPRLIEHVTT
ncbi:SUKH-4 family immunity protein [Streptomyces koyangensis]|uniref:SUKH-4 family immunity protein n=1 Tax=Streptomyces TaxID=1883 RepID=UPI001F5C9B90|nr:SUKH-4 family immunity protein [Streptomyces sp. SCA2-2]